MNEDLLTEDFLKVGRCGFCGKFLVVMDTQHSVLPVEVESNEVKISADEVFDYKKYKSHLLNCPGQQAAWEKKKWKYLKQRNPLAKFAPVDEKDLLR